LESKKTWRGVTSVQHILGPGELLNPILNKRFGEKKGTHPSTPHKEKRGRKVRPAILGSLNDPWGRGLGKGTTEHVLWPGSPALDWKNARGRKGPSKLQRQKKKKKKTLKTQAPPKREKLCAVKIQSLITAGAANPSKVTGSRGVWGPGWARYSMRPAGGGAKQGARARKGHLGVKNSVKIRLLQPTPK